MPEGQREIPGARGTPEAQTPRTGPPGGGGGFGGRPAVALTDAGQAAVAGVARSCRGPSARARRAASSPIGVASPSIASAQAGGTVTMQYGRTGMTRTVHVGMAAHPANVAPSREGHSIGRWENDVLVVDTVGFSAGHAARLDAAQCAASRRRALLGRHGDDHVEA